MMLLLLSFQTRFFFWTTLFCLLKSHHHIALAQQQQQEQQQKQDSCYSNTTQLALDIASANPTTERTYTICPNTIIPISSADNNNNLVFGSATASRSSRVGMLPLLLRANTTIQCGHNGGSSRNNCTLLGGLSQVVSLPGLFFNTNSSDNVDNNVDDNINNLNNTESTDNVRIVGITFENALETAALLGNRGDVTFVDCIFRNHPNLGPMNLVWNAPNGVSNHAQSELQQIIDQIIAIVNSFARPNYTLPASQFQAAQELEEARQVVTLEKCYLEYNNPKPIGGFTSLINLETGYNDLVVMDSIFRDNNLGLGSIPGAVIVLRGGPSMLDIRRTCFLNNTFVWNGPVVVFGNEATYTATDNYGTSSASPSSSSPNGEASSSSGCGFISLMEALGSVSCVPYDLDECAANVDDDDDDDEPALAPTSQPTVKPTSGPNTTQSEMTATPTSAPIATTSETTTIPTLAPTPAQSSSEFGCSVCPPGFIMTLPDLVVQLSPGVVENVTEASCKMIDTLTKENPDQITESQCEQLRGFYASQCGCEEVPDEIAPTLSPLESGPQTTSSPTLTAPATTGPPTLAPTLRTPETTASPTIVSNSTTAPPSLSEFVCSVCPPGFTMMLPDQVVQFPPGLVENVTEASCEMIDTLTKENPDQISENQCEQLWAFYKDQCGCKESTDEIAPTPSPVDSGTTASPTLDAIMTTQSPSAPTFVCSVCPPGYTMTRPNLVVPIPPGILSEDINSAPCATIDAAVIANSDRLDKDTCGQLRSFYQYQCGCEETEDDSPATLPPLDPDATPSQDACTVCEPGEVITRPNEVIEIPAGFIVQGAAFATCRLLETGLRENPGIVPANQCSTLRDRYREPCGCTPIEDAPPTMPPTDSDKTDGSGAAPAIFCLRSAVYLIVVVISLL